MKIAITTQGKDLNSKLDSRFGRAEFFIIFDDKTKNFEAISNTQNLNSPQGAGIQASQTIINKKAEVLITENCGPKAFAVLKSKNVKVFLGSQSKTAQENLDAFLKGDLKQIDNPNVNGHW